MTDPEFGELLRSFRHGQGLTIESLAHRAGASKQTVQELETLTTRVPYPNTVRALCSALELDSVQAGQLMAAAVSRRSSAKTREPAHTPADPPNPLDAPDVPVVPAPREEAPSGAAPPGLAPAAAPERASSPRGHRLVWPVITLLAGVVLALTAVVARGSVDASPGGRPSTPAEGEFGRITEPVDGDPVDSSLDLRGSASLVVGHSLWLAIRPLQDGLVYLTDTEPITVDAAGRWSTHVTVGRGPQDVGVGYDLFLLSSPEGGAVQRSVEERPAGQFSGRFEQDSFPPADAVVLDRIGFRLGAWTGR